MKSLKHLLALVITAGFSTALLADGKGKAAHWTYEGAHGPERWAALAPENAKCSQGKTQSPVNITDRDVIVSVK
ncbi:MAG: hypothetical protein EBT56_05360 [Betaproteobacteria bacterium]|nr:hypothetical protein [Betaproteobacteria bacterium]